MNLKLIESFVELIELGAFANKEDIVKGLNSAIKVTKEQAELTDEEILVAYIPLIAWEVFSSSLFRLENKEITNDEFIKRCYEVVKARCNHRQPDYTQNNTQSHPVKDLTDEEIAEIAMQCSDMDEYGNSQLKDYEFARAILRKAQEK